MIGGAEVPAPKVLRSSRVCHIARKWPPVSSRYHAVGLTKVMHQKATTDTASRAHRKHRAQDWQRLCMLWITPRSFCRALVALYLLGDDSMSLCFFACKRRNMLTTAVQSSCHTCFETRTCLTRALKPECFTQSPVAVCPAKISYAKKS